LAGRDPAVEGERDRIDRRLGERLQDLRIDGLVDVREATSLDSPKAQAIPSKNAANVQSFELTARH